MMNEAFNRAAAIKDIMEFMGDDVNPIYYRQWLEGLTDDQLNHFQTEINGVTA